MQKCFGRRIFERSINFDQEAIVARVPIAIVSDGAFVAFNCKRLTQWNSGFPLNLESIPVHQSA